MTHKLRCRFIFDFYIEFTDCQYLKNIGYWRSGKEDWADIYAKYINSRPVQADPLLKKVTQQYKDFGFITEEKETK